MPKLRTRLLDVLSGRRDDQEVLAVIRQLPRSRRAGRPVLRAALLDEAGQAYREVRLYGEYEALLFTARMNACGFKQVPLGPGQAAGGYDSVFGKSAALINSPHGTEDRRLFEIGLPPVRHGQNDPQVAVP